MNTSTLKKIGLSIFFVLCNQFGLYAADSRVVDSGSQQVVLQQGCLEWLGRRAEHYTGYGLIGAAAGFGSYVTYHTITNKHSLPVFLSLGNVKMAGVVGSIAGVFAGYLRRGRVTTYENERAQLINSRQNIEKLNAQVANLQQQANIAAQLRGEMNALGNRFEEQVQVHQDQLARQAEDHSRELQSQLARQAEVHDRNLQAAQIELETLKRACKNIGAVTQIGLSFSWVALEAQEANLGTATDSLDVSNPRKSTNLETLGRLQSAIAVGRVLEQHGIVPALTQNSVQGLIQAIKGAEQRPLALINSDE